MHKYKLLKLTCLVLKFYHLALFLLFVGDGQFLSFLSFSVLSNVLSCRLGCPSPVVLGIMGSGLQ